MRAFQILTLNHDLLHKSYHLEYCFAIGSELKKTEVTFTDKETLSHYLYNSQRDWLLACLENFVNHKKHIIESGKHDSQKLALQGWVLCLEDIHNKKQHLKTVCDRTIKGYLFLLQLLPAKENPSYQNSLINLQEIKKFCDNYLANPVIL